MLSGIPQYINHNYINQNYINHYVNETLNRSPFLATGLEKTVFDRILSISLNSVELKINFENLNKNI
ncbi:hypothetical protein C8D97_105180 [Pleionea mediterranea]|uniref:Uncharacterized protein n=1 Tax=Pleionea mediterranea TaxID=523701 RepID=A0A316FT34_9GAMM|nr:hypothetical protein C8D97_105180 [Pleionea mediterranea]